MEGRHKISPAFEEFMAGCGPNDKKDAIVVFGPPAAAEEPQRVRGRMRTLQQRLRAVRESAAAQQPAQTKVLDSYQREGSKMLPGDKQVEAGPVGTSTMPVAKVEVTKRTLPLLAERKEVVAVLPNQKIHLIRPKEVDYDALTRAETKKKLTWGLELLDIPKVWRKTKGEGVNVAVLDTGVYSEHEALTGRVKDFVVLDPIGRRINARPAFDCGTHGTHVCGTIAGGKTSDGVSIGVAPEVTLLVAGVLLGEATVETLIAGIGWAVERGADIINMSLGFDYYEPRFDEVLRMVIDRFGVLPVVAIGNENHGNSSSPGNVASAFSVGALEKMPRNKYDVAFFSSGVSLAFPGAAQNQLVTKPDVVAPGVQVYSCVPPETAAGGELYSHMDGTSMATPHVAGVAALLMSAYPEANVTDIAAALRETAKHPGGLVRPDNRWGYGLIQPGEALKALA
jgi:subtilisin family serine protease